MSTKLENAPVLVTELVHYNYNLNDSKDAEAYRELCRGLKSEGYKLFDAWGDGKPCKAVSGTVHLDCGHLFNNQWNTTEDSPTNPNFRVFDWHESIVHDRKFKSGHYLVITEEMRELRDTVLKCGYCGSYSRGPAAFCTECLGSSYLIEDDLHLLRMLPVSSRAKRESLTDEERDYLMPLYVAAQIKGAATEAGRQKAKTYQDIKDKADKLITLAETERDGMLWLMDNGVNVDNCIYYSHTDRFSFGWRSPVSESVKSALLDVLVEFPFRYEIKCRDGKTLENY